MTSDMGGCSNNKVKSLPERPKHLNALDAIFGSLRARHAGNDDAARNSNAVKDLSANHGRDSARGEGRGDRGCQFQPRLKVLVGDATRRYASTNP